MSNIPDTKSYNLSDHLLNQAVRSLSRLVSVKNIMRPFWNRWRASLIGDEIIMEFLADMKSLDDWPRCAMKFVAQEEDKFRTSITTLSETERVVQLRRLSYLCHMGQWGILPLSSEKIDLYLRSRDYYIEAETLANGTFFHRVPISWGKKRFYGNLHIPQKGAGPFPLIAIIHGMDDSKEEHLATELAFQEQGFAVFCFDGPGQAEALFVDRLTWPFNFHETLISALDALASGYNCDTNRVGVLGISWGGLWAMKSAAFDVRVKAVYDLGGPIHANDFHRIPFFLKTRFCQALGIEKPTTVPELGTYFSINDDIQLDKIRCPIRIMHGGKDPFVPTADKQWLAAKLLSLHTGQDVSLHVYPKGDHCCTAQGFEVRRDAVRFFARTLINSYL